MGFIYLFIFLGELFGLIGHFVKIKATLIFFLRRACSNGSQGTRCSFPGPFCHKKVVAAENLKDLREFFLKK
jgi:hypothetical protein